MYKVAGNVNYLWIAVSPTDPTKTGLGFMTDSDAANHATVMNTLLDSYDTSMVWNKDFWKTKPDPWVVVYNPTSLVD